MATRVNSNQVKRETKWNISTAMTQTPNELATRTLVHDSSNEKFYQVAWSGCKLTFLSHVQELRRNILLCDCKIVCAGKKTFFVHRVVLAAASTLMKKLLEEDQSEQTTVILPGVSASDLDALLDYIYNGYVRVNIKQLSSLLMAAQLLGITSLEKYELHEGFLEDDLKASDPLAAGELPHASESSELVEAEEESKDVTQRRKRLQTLADDELAFAQRSYCPSESPAKCPHCHVVIKQGRNLARHLSLKHNIDGTPKIRKKRSKSSKNLKLENPSEGSQLPQTVVSEETVLTSPEDEPKSSNDK